MSSLLIVFAAQAAAFSIQPGGPVPSASGPTLLSGETVEFVTQIDVLFPPD